MKEVKCTCYLCDLPQNLLGNFFTIEQYFCEKCLNLLKQLKEQIQRDYKKALALYQEE